MKELAAQVSKVVQATTRDSTTKKTIREIINDREGIIKEIKDPLTKAIDNWGLSLKDIELVEFKDADGTHVISDISSIIEQQIESEARQKNAEQKKIARLKEAEAEELAKKREIAKEEEIGKRNQLKAKLIAEKEKEARDKELDVEKIQRVKTQEIEKARATVQAQQEREVAKIDAIKRKEVESINKEQKKLEGEGDKIRAEEQAKGEAAPIREKGSAEAEIILKKLQSEAKGKDDLQKALNRFGDAAIRALVAELIVDKDKTVGVAVAEALKNADMRVYAGNGAKDGFDMGKLIEAINMSSPDSARALVHRMGKPNDLGFEKGFAIGKEIEDRKSVKTKSEEEKSVVKEEKQTKKDEQKKQRLDTAAKRLKQIQEGKKKPVSTRRTNVRM